MEEFEKMDVTQLKMLKEKLQIQYDDFKKQSLKLDMSRGKPNVDQLDLSMGIFECAGIECYRTLDGIDCRTMENLTNS